MSITIGTVAMICHQVAREHGWWDDKRTLGDQIALMHSELSEALEEYRNGHKPHEVRIEGTKPEGVPVELADCIIRIFDTLTYYGVDVEKVLMDKIRYNKSRPFRHGGKTL